MLAIGGGHMHLKVRMCVCILKGATACAFTWLGLDDGGRIGSEGELGWPKRIAVRPDDEDALARGEPIA